MKSPISILTWLCLLFLASCISNKKTSLEAFKQDVYTPEYATGFKIMGADNTASTLIQVSNPWQGAKDVKMSYFISRNGEQAPAGFNGPTIPAGAKRIVCMASSYIAMFDALGQVDKIVGVSGIDYVSNPYILAHKNSIKDMGPEMNYELLLGLKPDVVLLYGIGDAQTAVTDKLKELFIPYMYVGEYLEESPLGKAEWLVALSELTDSRKKGIEIFREIPKRYQVLKALTESVEQRPTVMLNTPWNDSWVMPSTQSYMAQLVTDAGADYIYKENNSNSSTPIGLETAYKLIQKADYWINVGMASTLDELKTVNPKFVDAKAVREKTVYNNNLRTTPTGGNDYWESAVVRPDVVLRDLIHIFHPELVSDIPITKVWAVLTGGECDEMTRNILLSIRFIRVVVAALIGIALSVSGLQMQTVFQNPLADPYLLGVSSGAGLGVALFILGAPLLGWAEFPILQSLGIVGSGWIGTAVILLGVAIISRKVKNILGVLIMGVMIGYVAGAIIQILQYLSSAEQLKMFTLWSMGSLSHITVTQLGIMIPMLCIGLLISVACIKSLNLLLLGENYARTMGMNIKRSRTFIFVSTALLTGTVTAFCGPVGFIGLAVPHVTRLLFNNADHRILVPGTMLTGLISMLLCDIIAKKFLLPVNCITALLGVPVILWVIAKNLRRFK